MVSLAFSINVARPWLKRTSLLQLTISTITDAKNLHLVNEANVVLLPKKRSQIPSISLDLSV
jgi:hypothetical protein